MDPKTFDPRNMKVENDSRLLPKKNWRFKLSIELTLFYKDILTFFNNKEILVGGRPVFIKEWFDSSVLSIRGLLNGNIVSYCLSHNFITSMTAIQIFSNFTKLLAQSQNILVIKARNTEPLANELYARNNCLFQLDDFTQIPLENAKSRDFYGLLNRKIHTVSQTGQ